MKRGDRVICNIGANKYLITKEGTEAEILEISEDEKQVQIMLPHGAVYCIDADCIDVIEGR